MSDVARADPSVSAAVLMGVGTYRSDFPSVPQAINGVRRLAKQFALPELWGLKRSRLIALDDPDRAEALQAVGDAAQMVRPPGLLVIYFVGHAETFDDQLCLVPTDGDRSRPRLSMVPVADLVDEVTNNGPPDISVLLLLDCCFAGHAERTIPTRAVRAGESAGWFLIGAADRATPAQIGPGRDVPGFTEMLLRVMEGLPGRGESLRGTDVFDGLVALLPDSSPVCIGAASGSLPWLVNRQYWPGGGGAGRPQDRETSRLWRVASNFTGRTAEIVRMTDAVDAVGDLRELCEVFAISGMPGVGKTALALYLAHRFVRDLSERAGAASLTLVARCESLGAFSATGPVDPSEVLNGLLPNDRKDPRKLQDTWLEYLADKLLILVLDDAYDYDQVKPFLPASSGHIVLVTSRRQLTDLLTEGALPVHLQDLEPTESEALVAKVLRRPLSAEDRGAVADIARLYGNNPMAMTLAVSGPPIRGGVSLAEWADRLTANPDLVSGEDSRMARLIGFSYRQLPADCQFMLRRMSLSPAPGLTAAVAGLLTGQDERTAARQLLRLEQDSLIEDDGRWYRLHDLIRQFAGRLAPQDGAEANAAAIEQVLTYYVDVAAQVDTAFTRQPPPPAVEPPATRVAPILTRQEAIARARRELPNLNACAKWTVKVGDRPWTLRYATALAGLLRNEGRWPESIQLQTDAIDAATELALPLALANALHERGLLYRLTSQLEKAETDLTRALSVYDEVGGTVGVRGRAHALNTFAVVLDQRKHAPEARAMLNRSRALCQQIGYPLGEANVLNDSGMTSYFAGDDADAITQLSEALALYKAVDQPLGQAHAHNGLVRALRRSGQDARAVEHLESMRRLYQELGNRLGGASTAVELAKLRRSGVAATSGDRPDSASAHEALSGAADAYEAIGNWIGVGSAYFELGQMHAAAGDDVRAAHYLRRALSLFRKHGVARDEEGTREALRRLGLDETET